MNEARQNRQEVPRPDHFSVKEDARGLRIRFRWIWRRFTGPATMCIAWNSFVVGWYWNALRTGGPPMWLAVIFCSPHAVVGLLLVYATLAGFLNRTVIKVTSEFLTVWNGPVPWWGNRRLSIDALERLYCDREPEAVKHRWIHAYRVNALTKEASKVDLVTELDRAQALFIRQELDRWLNSHAHGVGADRAGRA
jgi:hypothetical protein